MICLDTTALIRLMQEAKNEQETSEKLQIQRAFTKWEADHLRILIPAVVLGEFLMGFDEPGRQAVVVEVMQRNFIIGAYDAEAAIRASVLRLQVGGKEGIRAIQREQDLSKQCVKADLMIVATALSHRAQLLVCEDRGVREIAPKAGLAVVRLSELDAFYAEKSETGLFAELDRSTGPDEPSG